VDANLSAEHVSSLLYNLVNTSITAMPSKTSPSYFKISLFVLKCQIYY